MERGREVGRRKKKKLENGSVDFEVYGKAFIPHYFEKHNNCAV